MKRAYQIIAGIIIFSYFLIGVRTLSHYGTNWDEINHSARGQAYLYFFLTGKKEYDSALFQEGSRYSFYQMPNMGFQWHMKHDMGHPVVSDLLSAGFNYVFYQKLGWLGDFESYHLFGVVLTTLFLSFIFWWSQKYFGGFSAIVTLLSMVLFPLFYGESHFNVQKDIPETIFLVTGALVFHEAILSKSWSGMIATGLLFACAFGTKLNVVFILPVLILFALIHKKNYSLKKRETHFFFLSSFVAIVLVGVIYVASWPWLWQNPIENIGRALGFYREIGMVVDPSLPDSFYLGPINTYAIRWILFTTPLITLFLAGVGIGRILYPRIRIQNKTALFILCLFLIPIARVSFSFTGIYGGTRQIMEYIPPMALLSGIGAQAFVTWMSRKWRSVKKKQASIELVLRALIIFSFVPIAIKMIAMHPNESIYFNSLIGGLSGAAEKNIPGWGNSLGSTYRQGVNWINTHAEENAKLAFVHELMSNIPRNQVRSDIKFSNLRRSGPKQEGEYLIAVTHDDTQESRYNRQYAETFLVPVYEVIVDGVAVLKIWKNDPAHVKKEYQLKKPQIVKNTLSLRDQSILVSLSEPQELVELEIRYQSHPDCLNPSDGTVNVSGDGMKWEKRPGTLAQFPDYAWYKPLETTNIIRYPFAGQRILHALIHIEPWENSCMIKYPVDVTAWAY